ncbi:MAG: hypothetical protein ACF8MF_05545 [Phycisphaerales bacterium JB052]
MQLGPTTPPQNEQALTHAVDSDAQAAPNPQNSGVIDTQSDTAGYGSLFERFNAENSLLPNILIIGAMVLLVFLMMRSLRKASQSNRVRANNLGTPSERIAEIRDQAEQSMEPSRKLMVDAEDIARRLGAALDNKAARLELLIEEADAKLDQLNRAVARTDTHGDTPNEQSVQVSPAPNRTIDPALLDRARVEQDIEERQSRVAGRITPAPIPRPEPEPEISISDQVQALALQGKSSREIATELAQPIGQVELILNLQKRSEMS